MENQAIRQNQMKQLLEFNPVQETGKQLQEPKKEIEGMQQLQNVFFAS